MRGFSEGVLSKSVFYQRFHCIHLEVSHDEPQLEIEEEKEEEEEKVAEEEREDKEGEEVGELSPPVMIDDEEMNYNDSRSCYNPFLLRLSVYFVCS